MIGYGNEFFKNRHSDLNSKKKCLCFGVLSIFRETAQVFLMRVLCVPHPCMHQSAREGA
jgi:hypothetical protein